MKPLLLILCTSLAFAQSQRSHSISNTIVIRQGGSYLGVSFVDVPEGRGVQIKLVDEGSPAARAGLKPEDIVVEFNGQHVDNVMQFVRMVSDFPVGRKAALGILRAGAPLTLTAVLEPRVTLPEMPEPPRPPMVMIPDLPRTNMLWRTSVLGIETESLNPQMAEYFGVKEGVLIRMVSADSAAKRAGLKAGDVIVRAAGKTVAATGEVSALLHDRKSIALGIVRDHKEVKIEVLLN